MQKSHYQTLYESELNHWWYKARRELVHSLIKRHLGKNTALKILDVGCGTGALLKELGDYGEVHGIDFSSEAIDFCKSRGVVNVEKSILETITYPNGYFDLVLALDVLEHVPDDSKGISEIYRVLKPGGTVIIFVPAFKFLWGVTDVLSEHYRRYTRHEVIAKVSKQGFQIQDSSYFNFFLFPFIALSRFIVNLLKIKINSENNTGDGLLNSFLYFVFKSEVWFLRFVKFPFGVSCMVIAKK